MYTIIDVICHNGFLQKISIEYEPGYSKCDYRAMLSVSIASYSNTQQSTIRQLFLAL